MTLGPLKHKVINIIAKKYGYSHRYVQHTIRELFKEKNIAPSQKHCFTKNEYNFVLEEYGDIQELVEMR